MSSRLGIAGIVLLAAFGLAACGGGGGVTADTTPPPPPQAELDAIMIANLQGQINDLRAQLDLPADGNVSKSISELQDELAELREQVQDTADEDAKEKAAAAAADALALFNGIDESSTDLTVSVATVADKHGDGGMASFTVTGLTPGVGAVDVMKSIESKLGKWQGTRLTDMNAADAGTSPGTSSTVVVYTDIGAPKPVAFGEVYALDGNGNLPNAATISVTNRPKVKASEFVHTGRMNHDPDSTMTDDVARIRGTFNGAAGEYRCVASGPTACASHDAGNGVVRLEGTWIFDPDSGAMAMQADASYAYFGWWLNKGTTDGVEAGVFHGVTDLDGEDAQLAAPTDINALGGEATYTGAAAGKYALKPSLSPASGGHWTANASLTAKWGDENAPGTIDGMIDGFKAGDQDMDWTVKFGATILTQTGTFTGNGAVWTIGGVDGAEAGAWSGGLRGAGDNNVPTTVTGQFSATHSAAGSADQVGHIIGGFGATNE